MRQILFLSMPKNLDMSPSSPNTVDATVVPRHLHPPQLIFTFQVHKKIDSSIKLFVSTQKRILITNCIPNIILKVDHLFSLFLSG